MVPIEILDFLKLLAANNNKEWFQDNRPLYLSAKEQFEQVTARLIEIANEVDPSLGVQEPKKCIFRIFRDVRFAKDKSPYKTNFGAFVVSGGRKSPNPGYYLHVEPGNCFVGGGIHCPPPEVLGAIRREIYNFPEDLTCILEKENFKSTFGGIDADKLKGAPRGFSKDFPYVDLIKFKSYTVGLKVAEEAVTAANFESELKAYFETMKPFNLFLKRAVDELKH